MKHCKLLFSCAVLFASSACDGRINESRDDALNGYGDLILGMSYDEALSRTSVSIFNPVGVLECMAQRAIKGCMLSPENSLNSYKTIDGVPYALSLEFNKFDALTDIELSYERSSSHSEYEKVSKSECLSIAGRTIDSAWGLFGEFQADHAGEHGVISRKTPNGHTYLSSDSSGFLGSMSLKGQSGRRADLFFFYIVAGKSRTCHSSISISEKSKLNKS
jgi:hypothetical protein